MDFLEKNQFSWDEMHTQLKAHESLVLGSTENNLVAFDSVSIYMHKKGDNNLIAIGDLKEMFPISSQASNYILGCAIAHEFLHALVYKSFTCIYNNKLPGFPNSYPILYRGFGQHIIMVRNLNFPGNGLKKISDHKENIVRDKDIKFDDKGMPYVWSAQLSHLFYQEYLPKSNSSVFSPWGKICPSQMYLLFLCNKLRGG